MPEGDTLFRIARALDRVLTGRAIEEVRSPRPLGAYVPRRGARIAAIEARGKNLLVHFDGGSALRVHLGMHGSVHLYRPGEAWKRPAWLASLVVRVPEAVAVVFRAAVVRALRHPDADETLATLGPDVLTEDFDVDEACRRLRTLDDMPIGDALLDQRLLAGVGNVYKCEALFACRVDPFAPLASIDDTRLRALVATARASMLANLGEGPRRTRGSRRASAPGGAAPGARHWVYGRAGRPCFVCGALVCATRAGPRARVTWYCPRCQAVTVSDASHPPMPSTGATTSSSRTSSASSPTSASGESAKVPFKSRLRSRSAS